MTQFQPLKVKVKDGPVKDSFSSYLKIYFIVIFSNMVETGFNKDQYQNIIHYLTAFIIRKKWGNSQFLS
jgi:hypothetical protein